MIKFEYYPTLEDAYEGTMKKDYNHVLISHAYPKGTTIYPHTHNQYEWVIATHGHFVAESEGDKKEFKLDGEQILVIHYPEGIEHGLTVLGEVLEYFVMKY